MVKSKNSSTTKKSSTSKKTAKKVTIKSSPKKETRTIKSNKKNKCTTKKKIIVGVIALIIILALGSLFMGQSSSREAIDGDVVSVWYVGKLVDGEIFDTNVESAAIESGKEKPTYDTLTFTVGAGQMIAGFDKAIVGMKVGDKKTIEIEAEDAYGNYRDDLVNSVSFEEFETIFFPVENATEGMILPVQFSNGAAGRVKVITIGSNFVKLDMNHDLAGKKLVFEIELDLIKE